MGERIVNDNELYTMTSYQTASYFPNHNNYNNERRAIAPSDTVTGTSTLHTVNSDLDILSNNDNNNDVRPTAPSIGSSISPGISGNGSFREYAHHSSNNNNGNILEEEEMRTMTLIESSTSPTRRNNDSHIVEIDDYYNHDYNEAMNAIEDTNHTRGTNRNSAVTVRTGRQDTNVAGGPSDVFVNSTSDNSSPLVQSSLPFSRLLYTEQVKIRKRNKRIRKSSVGSPESSPTNRAEDPDKYIKGKKKRIKTFHQLNADEQVLLAFSRLNMMDYLNSYDGDYYYQKVKHTRDKTLLQEEELDHLCHVMAGLPSILDAYRVEGGHRIGQIPKLTSGGIGFISNLKFVRFRRAQVALDHSLNILFRVAIILCFVFFVMSFSFHLTGTGDPLTISNPSIEMYRYISDSRVERVEFREEDYFISRLEDRNGTFFSIFDQTNPPNSITHLPGVQNVFQVVGINSNDGSGSTIYGEMYRTVPVRYVIISSFCLVLALGFIWYHDYGILRKRMW
ncbi:hypothetical protein AGDE_16651 [Angomonas deanei]|nr:hypothetical protein AGDE_16651 [Angomonas deanei]|eukprot:EPY16693.1 hypothetical protein AGDE_16651 [Angomonas deanei]